VTGRVSAVAGRFLLLPFLLVAFAAAAHAGEAPPATQGQTVYAPVYSEVLYGNADRQGSPDKWPLSATLSIRNTDPDNSLTVRSVRYYDTAGRLVREYPAGRTLGPLGTMEVFVEHKDQSGGSGANFLVVWDADRPINPPIIETVHSYFFGTRAVVFVSPGQALRLEPK
jgi:hypothetical protein